MTQLESLAYMAGIVDGEGYIGIVKRNPGKNKMSSAKYTVRLSIAMTCKTPLVFIKDYFSIAESKLLIKRRHRPLLHNHKDCFILDVENDDALRVCRDIVPFLLVKNKQAELIIRLREFQNRTKYGRRIWTGDRAFLKDSYLKECEKAYAEIKILNKRGVE